MGYAMTWGQPGMAAFRSISPSVAKSLMRTTATLPAVRQRASRAEMFSRA